MVVLIVEAILKQLKSLLCGVQGRMSVVGPRGPRHVARTDPWVPLGGSKHQMSLPVLGDLTSLTSMRGDEGLNLPIGSMMMIFGVGSGPCSGATDGRVPPEIPGATC